MNHISKSQVPPFGNCLVQSFKRQLCVDAPIQCPANTFPAEQIKDNREIHKLLWEMNIGNICHPDLIEPCYCQIFDKIWIDGKTMVRLRCYWFPWLFSAAEKLLFTHKTKDSLMIYSLSSMMQLFRHSSVSIKGKLQGNLVHYRSQCSVVISLLLGSPAIVCRLAERKRITGMHNRNL